MSDHPISTADPITDDFQLSRREFIRRLLLAGCLVPFGLPKLTAQTQNRRINHITGEINYQFKVVSVDRLAELQQDINRLKQKKLLSTNKVFQSYIEKREFTIPDDLPEARSLIVVAVYTPMMRVRFHTRGKAHDVIIPSQYYDDGLQPDDMLNIIKQEVVRNPDARTIPGRGLYLKLLAVRAGLGRYGRNNICYVDGMGTFHTLMAFFSDHSFKTYDWSEIQVCDACEHCTLCYRQCPTKAIRKDHFVIDAGRCITLYNEIEGEFPDWIPKNAHNALMGCMRCQERCPLNRRVMQKTGRFADITEAETEAIISGQIDEQMLAAVRTKLHGFACATPEYLPMFTRNLSVLL